MSVVLVTGGAGYVGSHTVKALAAAGYDVVVYDDLSNGHAEAIARLAGAYPARAITLVRGDILDGPAMEVALRRSGATAVLHFAARLLVGESVREPLAYYRTNVTGTLTVLDAMRQAGASRFILSSTAATFGEPLRTPIDEDHPQQPVNAYGETKLAVERALPHVERACGIRWTALRYFNAAGADPDGQIGENHDPETHLIPLAIQAALGVAPPLKIFGADYPTADGTAVRDYIHVSDLADAHVRALDYLREGGESGAFNLGTERGLSVRQIVDEIRSLSRRELPLIESERRAGDPPILIANAARAHYLLGWQPRHSDVATMVGTAHAWERSKYLALAAE